MQTSLLKENLVKALSVTGRCLATRTQLPILSHILLKTEKNQLKVLATNLEISISYTIGAKTEKEGEIAIPGKLFWDFISSITDNKIDLIADGKSLTVKTNKNKALFALGNALDFPPFPRVPEKLKTFPLDKIRDSIQRVVIAASLDESRPVLTGVKTDFTQEKITLTATDGYRLSKEEVVTADKIDNFSTLLPASALAELVRISTEVKEGQIGFSLIEEKNQTVFTLPNIQFFTRIIEGEFPNTDKIIPLGFKTRVVVEKEIFIQAIKTTSLFARNAANIIKIKTEKEGLRISASSPQVGEDEELVEAEIEGDETEIAFNYRFLLDFLNVYPEKRLVFESSGPLNPGVFKSEGKSLSFLHIIMPVRVQG